MSDNHRAEFSCSSSLSTLDLLYNKKYSRSLISVVRLQTLKVILSNFKVYAQTMQCPCYWHGRAVLFCCFCLIVCLFFIVCICVVILYYIMFCPIPPHSSLEGVKIENKLTEAGINAKKCKNTSLVTTQNLEIGQRGNPELWPIL